MIICVCSFSKRGKEWEKVLKFQMPDVVWFPKPEDEPLSEWTKQQLEKRLPILFIGSTGIAVRIIAPFIKDKFLDSPVLVLDEAGRNLIPILSGHIGGGNELARKIAAKIGAVAIITTATDVHNVFSVDVFARKNAFRIVNKAAVKLVSEKMLAKKEICMQIPKGFNLGDETIPESIIISDDMSAESEASGSDVKILLSEAEAESALNGKNPDAEPLILVPKKYCVGIGCKKGKTFDELNDFLTSSLQEDIQKNIAGFASIDIKSGEIGLMNLSQYYHVDFKTFSAETLENINLENGEELSSSDFVRSVTGIDNVCERSALALAMEMGGGEVSRLCVKKTAGNGITLAVAERIPKICTWETK